MLTSIRILWSYAKKYWWLGVAAVGAVVAFLMLRSRPTDLADTLAQIRKVHEDEIAAIKNADQKRADQLLLNQQVLQDRMRDIEKQYADAQKQLDDSKRAEIATILKESGDDPDALAKRLSEATGIPVKV